jgi:hypothetical protein
LLCAAVVRFILNHFFGHAPYLLDSGWYSDIIYRAGLFPHNPPLACNYAVWYFGVHFSPLISVVSILSYLAPFPRIEWYAIFEAFVFLPFGIATYLLASRIEPAGLLRRLPVTVPAALAFTFSGLVVKMIPYPHYEGAIAGFICLLLVALVTGRMKLAWLFLALALAVREDAGVHTACALAPMVYLRWRGLELAASRRTLLVMVGVSLASTVIGVVCQKLVFHGAAIMSSVYLGDPIYNHLNRAVLVERVHHFIDVCQVLYYPFLATCVLAAARRDPRYLLGWAVTVPWFVLNFLAAQPQKATFESYASFPFVVSTFWVYVYGAALAPQHRRVRAIVIEAVFAGICLTATIGLDRAWPEMVAFSRREFVHKQPMDRAATHRFVKALGEHRDELGRLYADYPIAALALEALRPDDGWRPGVAPADAITFHNETFSRDQLLPDLFANQLDVCTHVKGTGIFLCTRDRLPADRFAGIATEVIPSSFAFASSLKRRGVGVDARGVTLQDGVYLEGPLGLLPQGTYELSFTLETDAPVPAGGAEMATLYVASGNEIRATSAAPSGAHTLSVRFDANGKEVLWFHTSSSLPSTLIITHAAVRQAPAHSARHAPSINLSPHQRFR